VLMPVAGARGSGERGQREAEAFEELLDPAHGCFSGFGQRVGRCGARSYIHSQGVASKLPAVVAPGKCSVIS